ncbi:Membrane protein involved in the export of O-antigen and teichoic acid [Quadrisphaera granulorum]|uniref:O-antigen/teichoic acid export membrane protein n=1 Tax=Quadrisphaera granulorum TaxID=317664 RepID=A0A316ASH3_9ACTN|nr:hypothetical protein [Quadrisphaera granulorum]PWJ53047.1 O-antigen/teichoic acid export membrane protein [Quadrisphaera granulorum]SZE97212.1 Membrane protein involved in the export of O-antigen and teichoic acid [Quadrisphaera granulorum]
MRGGFLGVAVATAVAAVFTLLLNAAVFRGSTTEAQQAAFTVFWYGALIVSFGVFLPLEQVVSRAASEGRLRGATVVRPALVLLVVAVGGVLLASPLLGNDAGTRTWVVVALVTLSGISALQYAARGLALGRGRMGPYAAALAADAVLRGLAATLVTVLVFQPPAWLFAVFVLASALLAHVGLLLVLRRQSAGVTAASIAGPVAGGAAGTPMTRAALTLLGASVAGQLLLNAGPIAVGLEPGKEAVIAAYGAAFTLARAPLFVVVPAQAVLVPPLTRMVAEGRLHELRVRMAQFSAAVVLVAAVGAGVGGLLARPAMDLFTKGQLQVPPGLMALMVGGCLVHAGLVVGTQALVATGKERAVLTCWIAGLVVAAAWIAVAQLGFGVTASWGVAGGFTAGSAAAWLLSVLVLVQRPHPRP